MNIRTVFPLKNITLLKNFRPWTNLIAYQINLQRFFPVFLIIHSSIIDQYVQSSKVVYSFSESALIKKRDIIDISLLFIYTFKSYPMPWNKFSFIHSDSENYTLRQWLNDLLLKAWCVAISVTWELVTKAESVANADLLNQNLNFSNIRRWFVCTLKLYKQ